MWYILIPDWLAMLYSDYSIELQSDRSAHKDTEAISTNLGSVIMKKDKNEWTYCDGCEEWFLDDEDCNCEQQMKKKIQPLVEGQNFNKLQATSSKLDKT